MSANTSMHRTVSAPLLLSEINHREALATGSTASYIPPDIDFNKLERGDLVFDQRFSDERGPVLSGRQTADYNSILREQSAPAGPLNSSSPPVQLPRSPSYFGPPSNGNQEANGNVGSYVSPVATWLWSLYYSNRMLFYCFLGLIIVVSTFYTAFTGEGSKYYVIILKASACYVFGTNRAETLFGPGFCEFGDQCGEHRSQRSL
ncbi:LADA_0A01024g1_1 [Lachancea dasiensis]|uniref:LADA_0A01024g1_1 n=1 Tax=Lachancea dasiensis TaxID=1072105 RepID=A0A1G4ILR0_9SACH|nr:LADA_0A01024g1_1 [Lachancea dasiensis]